MSASSFRINQPPATGYTYWDRARRDLVLGDVECEAQNKSESSYLWEIISAHPGETITITNPTSHTCQFTLATRYGYLVRLTVNAGEIDESQTTLYMGIALANSGAYLPALNETNQDNSQSPYDGSRGTEEKINDALIKFDNGHRWSYDETDDYLYPSGASTRIKGVSGTLANPSIGFSDDIDTGVYLPLDGVISFVSGGSEVLRMHMDSGDPYVDILGVEDFYIRNEGNPSGVYVATHIESRTTNSDPTGTSVGILSEAYTSTIAVATVESKSPGGTSNTTFTASTVGVAGGAATILTRAIGAGVSTATVSSETTGAYTATVNLQATSSSSAAIINVEPSGDDASSYLNLGGEHTNITMTDRFRTGSTYVTVLPLSLAQSDWNNFFSEFGSTSLLDAIYQAYTGSSIDLQSAYESGNSIATASGDPVYISGVSGTTPVLHVSSSNTGNPVVVVDSGDVATVPWFHMRRSGVSVFGIGMYDDDGIHIWTGGTVNDNNHIIFTTSANSLRDHDLGTFDTDPKLYIFSSANVDSDNTQWASITRDSSGVYFDTGDEVPFSFGTPVISKALFTDNVTLPTISSGELIIDLSAANYHAFNLSENVSTVTVVSPLGKLDFKIRFYTGPTGYTLDGFPSTWKWINGSPPFVISASKTYTINGYYDGYYFVSELMEYTN